MGVKELPVPGAIFGVRVHDLPSEQRIRRACERFLDGGRTYRIFTPNPEILLRARDDRSYADVLNSADLALPDGTGVALIGSLRTGRRVRRWPGIEVAAMLLSLAVERDAIVVLLGGAHDVTERAAARWRASLQGLRVEVVGAGTPIGNDGLATDPDREIALVEELRAVSPAIVLVGLGAPKQERWIDRHAEDLPDARILMGVGGAFDMWAGTLRRAPRWLRRVGLEWAWRLALEPRRIPRALRATLVFPLRALTDRAA